MGDNIRNMVFSKNIFYKFPPVKFEKVLCIADGKLELSALLHSMGYEVVAYEPKLRNSVSKTFKNNVKIFKKQFNRSAKDNADLIVGMHPDEATVEILMYGKLNNVSFE